jgi:predicted ATPase
MSGLRFFGRAEELAAVRARFAEGRRLVTLVGPGGSGKTRLAQELAMVAEGLVIVDGLGYVHDGPREQVRAVLEERPSARVVVTSRARLHLDEEAVVTVTGLDRAAAVTLFEDRARLVQYDFALTDATWPLVEEIVERLDRLPGAIELAATRIGVLQPADLLRRLSSCVFDALPPLDDAWSAAPPWAHTALVQLATAEDPMSVDVAEALIDVSHHHDAPSTLDVLAYLCDASLVLSEGGPGRTDARLRLLSSTRHHLRARAAAAVTATAGLRLVASRAPTSDPGTLRVEQAGASFVLPDGTRVDLTTRAPLRRLLVCLAEARATRPGASVGSEELLRRGWPGERMSREAGLHRVHVAVAELRKMGLGALLVRNRSGYSLGSVVDLTFPLNSSSGT